MADLKDLQRKLDEAAKRIPDLALSVFEVEGMNFIKKNFSDQGFNDPGTTKWKPRKTTDRKGRDLTRYRTNRVGTPGELSKFGREEKGRAILVGHNTGGDKLINSFRSRREKLAVVFFTYKHYAKYHNEGTATLPKRQFMGKSNYLDDRITKKITKELDKLFK